MDTTDQREHTRPGSTATDILENGRERRRRRTKVDLLEDLLPEHVQYRDLGCEVHPSCLSCPLPVCRYEVRGGLAAIRRVPRDEAVIARRQTGAGIECLCTEFSLSRRTVFRILAASRAKQGGDAA